MNRITNIINTKKNMNETRKFRYILIAIQEITTLWIKRI